MASWAALKWAGELVGVDPQVDLEGGVGPSRPTSAATSSGSTPSIRT